MRIAYITQSYPPMVSGAAIFAGKLAENMAQRGHHVLVIAASDRGTPYLAHNGKLSLLRLQSLPNPMRVGQRFALPARHTVLRFLHNFQPDFIHTHDPFQLGLIGAGYARRAHIPIALSIHQLPWFVASYIPDLNGLHGQIESTLWSYARWLLRQFTFVVTPTRTITDIVDKRTGIRPRTINYGLDLRTFSPSPLPPDLELALRQRFDLPARAPILLHVGRLDADKRVNHVIRAARQAMQNTDAHLLIVGNGCEKPALMTLCKSIGIAERAHFPGFVTVEQGLPEIYRLASLFITASEIETQGIVLLEAAASGLPIVAVRATCIPESVHDGVNGYLVEPNDTTTFGNAITELLLNPDVAKIMGKAGRRLAEKHDILATFDRFEHIYADSIRQNASQRTSEKIRVISWQERAKEWLNL